MSVTSVNHVKHDFWGCPCAECELGRRDRITGARAKGDLAWSEMPGRIHLTDESEPLPFFGLMFTFVGAIALGIFVAVLVAMGGIVLAQALWHAGLHSAGLLHQLHARLT